MFSNIFFFILFFATWHLVQSQTNVSTSCKYGYFFANNKCHECLSSCSQCTDYLSPCTSCAYGQRLNNNSKTCESCGKGQLTCSSQTPRCQPHYYLSNSKCLPECKILNCKTCTTRIISLCTQCKPGYNISFDKLSCSPIPQKRRLQEVPPLPNMSTAQNLLKELNQTLDNSAVNVSIKPSVTGDFNTVANLITNAPVAVQNITSQAKNQLNSLINTGNTTVNTVTSATDSAATATTSAATSAAIAAGTGLTNIPNFVKDQIKNISAGNNVGDFSSQDVKTLLPADVPALNTTSLTNGVIINNAVTSTPSLIQTTVQNVSANVNNVINSTIGTVSSETAKTAQNVISTITNGISSTTAAIAPTPTPTPSTTDTITPLPLPPRTDTAATNTSTPAPAQTDTATTINTAAPIVTTNTTIPPTEVTPTPTPTPSPTPTLTPTVTPTDAAAVPPAPASVITPTETPKAPQPVPTPTTDTSSSVVPSTGDTAESKTSSLPVRPVLVPSAVDLSNKTVGNDFNVVVPNQILLPNCNIGEFVQDNQCQKCQTKCLTCIDFADYCLECAQGWMKLGWKCVKNQGLAFNLSLMLPPVLSQALPGTNTAPTGPAASGSNSKIMTSYISDLKSLFFSQLLPTQYASQPSLLTLQSLSQSGSSYMLSGIIDKLESVALNEVQSTLVNKLKKMPLIGNFVSKSFNIYPYGTTTSSPSNNPQYNPIQPEKDNKVLKILIPVLIAVGVCLSAVAAFCCYKKKQCCFKEKDENIPAIHTYQNQYRPQTERPLAPKEMVTYRTAQSKSNTIDKENKIEIQSDDQRAGDNRYTYQSNGGEVVDYAVNEEDYRNAGYYGNNNKY